MFKGKKIFITIIVLVLMVAMAVTAYATSYTCTLYASNTGSVHTATMTTNVVHCAGFNQPYSDGKMSIRLQIYANGWCSIPQENYNIRPNEYHPGFYTWYTDSPQKYRTKIYSASGDGGVEGVASVNNF